MRRSISSAWTKMMQNLRSWKSRRVGCSAVFVKRHVFEHVSDRLPLGPRPSDGIAESAAAGEKAAGVRDRILWR